LRRENSGSHHSGGAEYVPLPPPCETKRCCKGKEHGREKTERKLTQLKILKIPKPQRPKASCQKSDQSQASSDPNARTPEAEINSQKCASAPLPISITIQGRNVLSSSSQTYLRRQGGKNLRRPGQKLNHKNSPPQILPNGSALSLAARGGMETVEISVCDRLAREGRNRRSKEKINAFGRTFWENISPSHTRTCA